MFLKRFFCFLENKYTKKIIFLENIINDDIDTFCYPYGGFHSFNKNIEKYLELEKVSFSVNVEKKNVSKNEKAIE